MRNVAMPAAMACLCACLLGGAGCDGWEWPPNSHKDRPDPDDQPAVVQETPEQKTIRTQGETIAALQVDNEQLKDNILDLANAIVGFQEDIEGLEFALEKQKVISESLDDALEQRDRYQLRAGELADENRRLEERMQVLAGENEELQALLDELHEKYEQLLDAASGELSEDEDEDDDADDDDDEDRSRIHFND